MSKLQGISFSFEAIGTHWQIDIKEDRVRERHDLLFETIKKRIELFDYNYSRFRDDSLVTAMSRAAGMYQLPDDAAPLIELYEQLYRITGGAFTPLIGSVLEEAGYDAEYSLTPREMHAPLAWDEAIAFDTTVLTMKKPAMLDFGAAGKGYLIDIVGALMREHGVASYIIDAGGDILHRGNGTPLRVGLEHPENPQHVIGVLMLDDGSVCCSAGNRRAWGGYHHIIDPRTLSSPRDVVSSWTVADDAFIADAMATALFLAPASALAPHFDFEYLVMRPDFSVEYSSGFHAELFNAHERV